MASITIRNLDDDIRTRLRVRAAGNGRSMEEEVSIIRSYFGPENGVDLELPERDPAREPPPFK